MARTREALRLGVAVLGAGAIFCIAFGVLLAHRTDYVGHFAAGYGGTLGLLTLILAADAVTTASTRLQTCVLVVVVVSIGLGAVCEETVFRLAQFDVVDFCNQSIGAVLAALAFLAARPSPPLDPASVCVGLGASIVFLIAGFILAFA